MNSKAAEISRIESAGTVGTNTLKEIYQQLYLNPKPDWGELLSSYSIIFQQIDSIYNATDDTLFLHIPAPVKPTANPQDLPQLLSTNLSDYEREELIAPEPLTEAELRRESELQEELNEHNLSIRALADKFEKELRARWQDRQRLRRSDESRRKRSDSGRRATQEEERELFAALR